MRIELTLNGVERETEKAILVNVMVSFNSKCSARSIWMPKSVCSVFECENDDNKLHAMVEDWFLEKTSRANAFNGYYMEFETAFARN